MSASIVQSKRRGIISNSSEAFLRFFYVVQDEAEKLGKVFFISSAEGNDADVLGVHAENMSGWLIDEADSDMFEAEWLNGGDKVSDSWLDFMVWEEWSVEDDKLIIEFEHL